MSGLLLQKHPLNTFHSVALGCEHPGVMICVYFLWAWRSQSTCLTWAVTHLLVLFLKMTLLEVLGLREH